MCHFPGERFSFESPFVSFRRSVFDCFLAEKAKARGAKLSTNTAAVDVSSNDERVVVKLRDKSANKDYEMAARAVVFADGYGTLASKRFRGVGF